uniref:Uncharacterized protein n=1 Tax=Wuchereria bancrofti TaxID=6293 RepID=A0A1I8EDF8_WUCBA
MTGLKFIITLIFILQASICGQAKDCSYNPFLSRSNDFNTVKTKPPVKDAYDFLNNISKQISQTTKRLCIFIKHNADAILYGSIAFLILNIIGALLVVFLLNLKIMFELQIISENTKILQTDLEKVLKKINENVMLSNSKLNHNSFNKVNAAKQTYPILHLFRKRELNEEETICHTNA